MKKLPVFAYAVLAFLSFISVAAAQSRPDSSHRYRQDHYRFLSLWRLAQRI